VAVGTVVRFDEIKGYGFVAPDTGDDDVFIHANDLLFDKWQLMPGRKVEYQLEEGDRGPKASRVRLLDGLSPSSSVPTRAGRSAQPATGDSHDDLGAALHAPEYLLEVTESLLVCCGLSGEQILEIRQRMLRIAEAHGWVENAPTGEQ